MRISFSIGAVAALGAALAAAACGGSSSDAEDTGSSGTSGSSGDDKGAVLKAGKLSFLGVTTDDQVVYTVAGAGTARDIETIPLAGGSPTPIGTVASDDHVSITGGVVAFWTAVVEDDFAGTLNLWTKAAGVKTNVALASSLFGFRSSVDGSRIAFRFNRGPDTGAYDVAVTTPGAPSTTANATTAIVTNVTSSASCTASMRFVKTSFFSSHCTGGGTGKNLVTVPDVPSPTPRTLVDGSVAADALRPEFSWTADLAGTKVFVLGGAAAQGRVITVATGAVANIETDTTGGFLSGDGTTVFYSTKAGALKRAPATNNPAPVVLVAAGFAGLEGRFGADATRVVFHSLAPSADFLTDLKLVDTTAPGQAAINLLGTVTGSWGAFTGTGSHVVYRTDVSTNLDLPSSGKLKVRPVTAGGVEVEIAATADYPWMLTKNTKGVFADNSRMVSGGFVFDLKAFDAAGGTPTLMASGIGTSPAEGFLSGFWLSSDETKVIYAKPGAAGGLYVAPLP